MALKRILTVFSFCISSHLWNASYKNEMRKLGTKWLCLILNRGKFLGDLGRYTQSCAFKLLMRFGEHIQHKSNNGFLSFLIWTRAEVCDGGKMEGCCTARARHSTAQFWCNCSDWTPRTPLYSSVQSSAPPPDDGTYSAVQCSAVYCSAL